MNHKAIMRVARQILPPGALINCKDPNDIQIEEVFECAMCYKLAAAFNELVKAYMTQELQSMPHNILRDIARNEAADPRYRKAAVRLLLQADSPLANIPDLFPLVSEVRAELQAEHEVTDIVEQAVEEPMQVDSAVPEQVFGAPSASFTTSSMFRDDER